MYSAIINFRETALQSPLLAVRATTPQTIRSARVSPAALGSSIEMMGAAMMYSPNTEIYGESEPAEYIYKVISGAVRTYKVLSDGRRQIGGFYLPGDLFGLERSDEHSFSAEAITGCRLLVVRRANLVSLASRDGVVARQIWVMIANELRRAQDHLMLLIKTAQERVAGFLLEMASRSGSTSEVELPMSRRDIADYLGLTIETVSRTLTQLAKAQVIIVPTSRHITLRNRAALARMNG